MSKLRKKFSEKEWQECCGKVCDDCRIALAYKKHYGRSEGGKKLKKHKKKFY